MSDDEEARFVDPPPPMLQNVPFPPKLEIRGNLANNWKRCKRVSQPSPLIIGALWQVDSIETKETKCSSQSERAPLEGRLKTKHQSRQKALIKSRFSRRKKIKKIEDRGTK